MEAEPKKRLAWKVWIMSPYYFDEHYLEHATLSDGHRVYLRCIRPEDKALLVEGLGHLSIESRYHRFFTAKKNLTESELTFLTEVDGIDHFAIGAAIEGDDQLHGVGVARVIRLKHRPEVGEPAVTVVDEMQGKGLGHLLFLRLVAAARERGITRFHCEVQVANRMIHYLLDEVPTPHTVESQGAEEVIEFDLPDVSPDAKDYTRGSL